MHSIYCWAQRQTGLYPILREMLVLTSNTPFVRFIETGFKLVPRMVDPKWSRESIGR